MGTVERRQYSIMRAFLVVFLAVAVSAEADPYTLGQVAAGATNGGVVTGVDYGHGVVAGVGAVGTGQVAAHVPLTYTTGVPAVGYPGVAGVYGAGVYGAGVYGAGVYGAVSPYAVHTIGKREAEPYTLAQVAHGLTNGGVVTNAHVVPATYAHVGYPYIGVYGAGVYGAGVHGAVTYAGVNGVPAVPAVTYAATPAVTYAGVPAVAGSAVHSGTTNKLFGHAVAYTPFGATHSANVGVCTNNDGAVVAC